MKYLNYLGVVASLGLLFGCISPARENAKGEELPYVLVIGVDGLGAHGLSMGQELPNFDFLMKNGAYSLDARTIMPSVSGPSWTTILTGTTPERHSVGDNDWRVNNRPMEPVVQNEQGLFPTMFGEIRAKYPDAVLGAVYHWSTIGDLIEKGVCNLSVPAESEDDATRKACDFIVEKKPNLTFVHLDHQDHAGHSTGYQSEVYAQSTVKTDTLIGVFIESLKKAGLFGKTFIFIVADHGGLNKSHGGPHRDEMTVPIFILGPGVKKGYQIKHPIFNYDIAPTIEWLFDVTSSEWVVGKPLTDVFEKNN